MPTLRWRPEMIVGVDPFDAQHHTIVQMLGALRVALEEGRRREAIGPVLTGFVRYAVMHFHAEEEAMLAAGFAGFDAHQREHDLFARRVLDLQERHQQGRITLTVEVMDFLDIWVERHILSTDRQYNPCLAGRAAA